MLITAPFVDNFRGKIMKLVQNFWSYHEKTVSLPPELWRMSSNRQQKNRITAEIE